MLPGRRHRDASARCPADQTLTHEERLGHGLDRLRLLPDGHRERREADRTATEPGAQRRQDCPVQAIEAEHVDLVHLERSVRGGQGEPAVPAHLGPVAHATQETVGDPRCPPRPRRDLGRRVGVEPDAEQARRADEHAFELVIGVEVEVTGEAEAVPQRGRQQPRARRRPDHREGRQRERDGARPRPLADDDVDPEVLHRDVQQLLRRSRDPVDLVEEEHLALLEGREHSGEVTGVLDRRARRDPQGRPELRGDDHRQGGLPETRGAGEQYVVRGPATAEGSMKHERELVADDSLPHELIEAPGTERRFRSALDIVRAGPHDSLRDDLVALPVIERPRLEHAPGVVARRAAPLSHDRLRGPATSPAGATRPRGSRPTPRPRRRRRSPRPAPPSRSSRGR